MQGMLKGGTGCRLVCVSDAHALERRSRAESFVCRSQRTDNQTTRQPEEAVWLLLVFFLQQVQEWAVVQDVFSMPKLWPSRG